ncbi:MAG: oligoribonuclease [Deltaproteobacteria bacterium]|nr:oligoribonuclease [Deltaproteobacteria bacterium]
MTGLDPEQHVVLEAGVIITGPDLEPRAQLAVLVRPSAADVARMDEVARAMHAANGLLERACSAGVPVAEAETQVLGFLQSHVERHKGVLAGNSVHADRAFLRRHMPSVEGWLHYRHIDVSSLKVLTRAWFPAVPFHNKPGREHTTLADLALSLEELRHYRRTFFRVAPPDPS